MGNLPVSVSVSQISDFLQVLSSPTRLHILQALRNPQQLGDVCVPSKEGGRHISRQAVRRHLDLLIERGLIKRLPGPKKNRDTYLLDRGGVFLLADQIRQLTNIQPISCQETGIDQTRGTPPHQGVRVFPRPRIMTVYGPDDGAIYSLGQQPQEDEWVIGRGVGASIRIEHDPYLSHRHAKVIRKKGGFLIQDLSSRNGTFLNLQPVGTEPVPWHTGDVVALGRTRLLMQT